jgi:hypothetical protein
VVHSGVSGAPWASLRNRRGTQPPDGCRPSRLLNSFLRDDGTFEVAANDFDTTRRSPARGDSHFARHRPTADEVVSTRISRSFTDFCGPPGLDSGTLGSKGTVRQLRYLSFAAHFDCFKGIALYCVDLLSWCCGSMKPKMRPIQI